tara:strand:+ start:150 stop:1268 length:1119 start_codon:yes stop_codon:yes gene_type:complete
MSSVNTPILPDDIQGVLLDSLNNIKIKENSTVLNSSMIIDNPLAVYTKLVGDTHTLNRFAGITEYKALVLINMKQTLGQLSYFNFVRQFIPSALGGSSAAESNAYICMIPELNAALTNPFKFIASREEFFRRAVRFPIFEIDSTEMNPTDKTNLSNAQAGSIVNVRFDNSDFSTGFVTKLVAAGNLDKYLYNVTEYDSAPSAYFNGDLVDSEGRTNKAPLAAELREGFSTADIESHVTGLVSGGRLTSDYSPISGPRIAPVPGASTDHRGIDIGSPEGTPIRAPITGVVTFVGASGRAGNMVKIESLDGQYQERYMHLLMEGPNIIKGQTIYEGDTVGFVGNTGGSSASHLHFDVKRSGTYMDPFEYLRIVQ